MQEKTKAPQQRRVPDRNQDIKDFMNLEWKKYWKNNKHWGSKKEIREEYIEIYLDLLPTVTDYVFNNGYLESEADVREKFLQMLANEDTLDALLDECKEDDMYCERLAVLPSIIREMLIEMRDSAKAIEETADNQSDRKIEKDAEEIREKLLKIVNLICQKKIKKLKKKGVDRGLALDLSCILVRGEKDKAPRYYQISEAMRTIYEYAESFPDQLAPEKPIPFDKLMSTLVGKDNFVMVIQYALSERSDKRSSMTDKQKAYWDHITQVIFSCMETYDGEIIDAILKKYVETRKRDFGNGKDTPRRFHLVDVPESEFPRIAKKVRSMIANDESVKKFLD